MRNPNIPSMGGTKIGAALRELASTCPENTAIVEFGCWLGAGTWQLSQGAQSVDPSPTIHVFDRFRASRTEVNKAAAAGVQLKKKMDTLPVVRKLLEAAPTEIKFHKCDIFSARWGGEPIGLFVDDAAKSEMAFRHILHLFGPHWIPGQTCLALMDFHYWKKKDGPAEQAKFRFQYDFVKQHSDSFEPIESLSSTGTSTAFFRYTNPLDFSKISLPQIGLLKKMKMALGS